MKKNIKKIMTAFTAAVLCAVPMMNGINASANEYVLKSGSFPYPDFNHDHIIDETDYKILDEYIVTRNTKGPTPDYYKKIEEAYPCIGWYYVDSDYDNRLDGDYNGDGVLDELDAELIRLTYTLHPEFNYNEAVSFYQGINKKRVSGDANGDLVFDRNDPFALSNYLRGVKFKDGKEEIPRILFNRSNMNGDRILDQKDLDIMLDRLKGSDPLIRDCLSVKGKYDFYTSSGDWCSWIIENSGFGDLFLNPPTYNEIKGDANGDGIVDMSDAVIIQQYLVNPIKYPQAGIYYKNSDIYSKGKSYNKITVEDLTAVQLYCSG
ncbi:MAG: dockerin type I repeat-containing protein, partial [Ruminococcus sp.]|nr:dockerin type I repeat-containing protein [Ruminococcus sp.]